MGANCVIFFAVNAVNASSVNLPTAATLSAQSSARPNKVAGNSTPQVAGQNKSALEVKLKEKPDLLGSLKAIEAQIAARAKEAVNVNTLDISYNKKQAMLSVKVEQQQTGQLIRELQFKDYKAMAYSPHSYKGSFVDIAA